jgi:hypothetical protein
MPISLPQEASLAAHWLPPVNDPRVHPAYPDRPRGRAGHCPTTSRRRPGPNRRLGWPSSACASFEHEAPTRANHEPVMDAAGDHADPGHPSHTAACPRRAPGPHFGRTQRTRQRIDTGRRTADTWTLRRPHRILDSGPVDRQAWTLVARTGHRTPDTGHRTLAEDVDRVTKARPASGPPGPPRRATARWDAQPCSCGRRLRRSTAQAGSAVRPPLPARDSVSPAAAWSLRRGRAAARRTAVLGMIRVERRAAGEASSVMQGAQMELAVEGLLNGGE